jgi:hypothetical protein
MSFLQRAGFTFGSKGAGLSRQSRGFHDPSLTVPRSHHFRLSTVWSSPSGPVGRCCRCRKVLSPTFLRPPDRFFGTRPGSPDCQGLGLRDSCRGRPIPRSVFACKLHLPGVEPGIRAVAPGVRNPIRIRLCRAIDADSSGSSLVDHLAGHRACSRCNAVFPAVVDHFTQGQARSRLKRDQPP